MRDSVAQALNLWDFQGADCTFIAGRENRVYKVRTNRGEHALRFKRRGYRSLPELVSELQWLEAMYREGLSVPRPRPSLAGRPIEEVDGQYVDVVDWLPGLPLGRSREPLAFGNAPEVFRALGRELARLHAACDAWGRPEGFVRCAWNVEGLLGDSPIWGRFWDNPTLDPEVRRLLLRFRGVAQQDLDEVSPVLDYGLIHADLVRENVLVDGPNIRLIDFDDGGYGFRLFDIATALIKNRAEPSFSELKAALIAGYRVLRPLDERRLDLFMALRAVTYVGWIVPRMDDAGALVRNENFINDACYFCTVYLERAQAV